MGKNLAVLVVDMQPFFLEGEDYLKSILDSEKKIIEAAKKNDFPIFVLEYSKRIHEFGETISEVKGIIGDYSNVHYIEKFSENGFIVNKDKTIFTCIKERTTLSGDNNLDYELQDKDIRDIVITGVNKYGCVLETAKEAIRRGYNVLSSHTLMNEQNFNISHGILHELDYGWHEKNTKYFDRISDLTRYIENYHKLY